MNKQTEVFKNVLQLEANSIKRAMRKVDSRSIYQAQHLFQNLIDTNSSLFCIGIGKSGFIAKKIASTFNSLGLSSYFLHPTEALHGDLGLIKEGDAAIIISNSGTTEEIMKLLPFLPIKQSSLIGLIGNMNSPIADYCHATFDCYVEEEACINNQAPTASTTVALAVGDALAVLYEHIAGLTKEGFAKNHPGGKLGKSLNLTTGHLMTPIAECPSATPSNTLLDILLKMTNKPTGMCSIFENNKFIGILVEGDIRRILAQDQDALHKEIKDHVNKTPITVQQSELAVVALNLMENRKSPIGVLPVLDGEELVGTLRIHDILKAGL